MKRKILIDLLLLVLMFSGCNDYTIKTKINPDGSFEKTVICEGDSLGLYQLPLPFVFSDGWKIETEQKAEKKKSFITTATKKYTNAEELETEYTKGQDSIKLKISSRIEKRFRWFFTYYNYEETIPAFGLFKQTLPIDSFFTPQELGRLKDTKDSLLQKRFDEYYEQNIVGEFIENLIMRSQELNDPTLTRSRWEEHRKTLTRLIFESKSDKPEDIAVIIEKVLQTSSVRKLHGAIDTSLTNIMTKVKSEKELEVSYKNEVVMPGILITSNSKKVEGNKLMWDCKSDQYFDVVMTAESRMVNVWAMILTAIVCVALLIGLLIPVIHLKK
ncbi:MAG TPA: hypothetical protein DCQ28_09860 [Bacteroidetes bacterium]|nr:hypothetical protein [Bacteroidota bacterium]